VNRSTRRPERIRELAVDFLVVLDDCEYERRCDESLSLATFERLRRAHAEIGTTLEQIRLDERC
jgi:hypothetical protein